MKVFIEFAQDPGLYPKENWFVSRTNIKGGLEGVQADNLADTLFRACMHVGTLQAAGTLAIEEDGE